MRVLIVEDDFVNRRLLQIILKPYGDCDVAVDGQEAVNAFKMAHGENEPYNLICMDIMMPGMDGRQALKEIRRIEKERSVVGLDRVKVIMTTVLDDPKNIIGSFMDECEAYLVKPIEKQKLLEKLKEFAFIK